MLGKEFQRPVVSKQLNVLLVRLIVTLSGRDGRSIIKPIYPWTHFGDKSRATEDGSIVLWDINGDGQDEMVMMAAFGAWGAMDASGNPLWVIDPGYGGECMLHGGLGDLDGDGHLELGMPHNKGFRAYNAATGILQWTLGDIIATTDVISVDIDGDASDEFIFGAGRSLVAVGYKKQAAYVLWQLDLKARLGPPIAADINGDGLVEVLVGTEDGRLHIITGQ